MKKVFVFFIVLIFLSAIWYGESRKFYQLDSRKVVTVWKTYDNTCYIIFGKYYGFFKPSLKYAYIKTSNTSSGVGLIWKEFSDSILVQVDDGGVLHNNPSSQIQIIDYRLNKLYNDSIYTYFDTKLKVRRYKKNINIFSVPINEMGAL